MSIDTDSTNIMHHDDNIAVVYEIEEIIEEVIDSESEASAEPPQEITVVSISPDGFTVEKKKQLPTNVILLGVIFVGIVVVIVVAAVFFDGIGDAHKESLAPSTEPSLAPTVAPTTAEPSSAPSRVITRPPRTDAPSSAPTGTEALSASPTATVTTTAFSPQREVEFCETNLETVLGGLDFTSHVLKQARLSVGLPAIKPSGEAFTLPGIFMGHKFLVPGVHEFVNDFIGANGRMEDLSPAIAGSIATNWVFDKNGLTSQSLQSLLAAFDQINENFKAIGKRLPGNSNPLLDGSGFDLGQIQGSVAGKSLIALTARYAKFVHSGDLSVPHRQYNAFEFHDACLYQYNPMDTFSTLYAHACEDCEYFKGQAAEPLLDQYVALANKEFPNDVAARIVWFQQEFTAPVMKAMIEAMYLSSTCLFSPFPTCFDADLQWVGDMEEMGAAMKEVAETMAKAENRMGCAELQNIFSYPCY